ncbi:hypothetical protein [Rhodobacter sp. CZR27]|uniref:hypothetical protein n=1 Tax=Rhodobacter sp. CZR27 TaxID=2033869 RepID=UPI000BBEAB54|nr:hypothetical protein [Rhodobacter sp. CZR27]
MIRLRLLFVLMLGLVLVASSVTVAVARGQAALGRQVVICTGLGVTTLAVDAGGRPLGPVHPCPDCLGSLLIAALTDAPALPAAPAARGIALRLDLPRQAEGPDPFSPCARGPPVGFG